MIMDNPVLSTISAEEYFRIEETSEVKHEYFQGDMYAMAGAGSGHNLIVSNLIRALGNQLRTSPCLVSPSDMRVQLNENSHYTFLLFYYFGIWTKYIFIKGISRK